MFFKLKGLSACHRLGLQNCILGKVLFGLVLSMRKRKRTFCVGWDHNKQGQVELKQEEMRIGGLEEQS